MARDKSSERIFPFHSASERDWLAWLGLYVMLWASTEEFLATLIKFLIDYQDGHSVAAKHPLNLEDRIKFLERAAAVLLPIADEREELISICIALRGHSDFRHLVVHGTKRNIYVTDPHFAFMAKLKNRRKLDGEVVEMRIDQAQLEDEYHAVGLVSLGLVGCSRRLHDAYFADINASIAALEQEIAVLEQEEVPPSYKVAAIRQKLEHVLQRNRAP